jgi:DNA processing protein
LIETAVRVGFRLVEPRAWPRLLSLPDPPALLFQRGDAPAWDRGLAVVGARSASAYGLRTTRTLVGGAAAAGVATLSGLARGIDARAHETALEAGRLTVAILGCGPDRTYPPEHRALQDRIGREGLVFTEYLPGTPPLPYHFPRRNRILVALADAVLVVEARRRSGSLTSAAWAADLGREVLVVPGPIDSELSEGPIALLRDGATPVASVEHVLAALGIEAPGEPPGLAFAPAPSDQAEERVAAFLRAGPLDLDELICASGDAPSRVLTLVLALEARGVVVREADGRTLRLAGR